MNRVGFAVAAVFLAACATPYQPKGFRGGFSETQLGENIFRVGFRGNGYTSGERATDFSLLRAAELTVQHGYRFFIVVDESQQVETSTYTTPAHATTNVSVYGNNSYATGTAHTTVTGGDTYLIRKPTASNMIVCLHEKPDGVPVVFEAEFVRHSVQEKYGLIER